VFSILEVVLLNEVVVVKSGVKSLVVDLHSTRCMPHCYSGHKVHGGWSIVTVQELMNLSRDASERCSVCVCVLHQRHILHRDNFIIIRTIEEKQNQKQPDNYQKSQHSQECKDPRR